MDERAVVTGFLRNDGELLLLRRSDEVGSYRGQWGGVAGHVEDTPAASIRREIREETAIDECTLVREGEPFSVEDADLGRRWIVHPYLFESPARSVTLDWEHTDAEWTSPTEILCRETVPELWNSYDAVRPTAEAISADSEHGSAWLSIRALEVLRDEAGLLAAERESEYGSVEAVADALLDARPAMTVVANRIHRVMAAAALDPPAVERAAREQIDRAVAADRRTAANLGAWIDSRAVATLSRSGTVLQAVEEGDPESLLVPESRPGGEGVAVAEALAAAVPVTLTSDAGFAHYLAERAGVLVVGADSILPDGTVINKVGTRGAGAAAARADVPVVVGAATDKIRPDHEVALEPRPASELYDGSASVAVENPTFDPTPPSDVDVVVTETGELRPDEIESVARSHRQRRGWR